MSKVLITGAQGFLGVRLAAYLNDRYEVLACSHSDLDITELAQLQRFFQQHRPDYVVHCAAISDTGYSQQHPEASRKVNVEGAVNVAKACAEVGAQMVYMSSDQVYNGTPLLGGLSEDVPLCPTSVYGQDKLLAEQRIGEVLSTAVGLRLTWMYDCLDSPYRLNRNLLYQLERTCTAHEQLSVATREFRGITWVWDVVQRIEKCFTLPGGVYNFGCENSLNSYETFLCVAQLMNLKDPQSWLKKDEDRFPDHPRNLSMDISRLRQQGITFPDTLQGVAHALSVAL